MEEEILPICAGCKAIKINNKGEKDRWLSATSSRYDFYSVRQHALEHTLTHIICPECLKKYYPEHHEQVMRDVEELR